MRRVAAVTLATIVAMPAAGLLLPRTVAHAAPDAIPANACAPGSDAQCRDYIVPTTWKDASGNPVDIFLEVEHATDAAGNIVPAPLILTYSPYSILGRNGDASHWNALGYSRAYADVVGTGNSGGCWDYGGQGEKQTAYDVIEAIAAQPWSNGKIGMLGGSYDGTTQYAAAVTHPPHLVTIVPEAAIDRWYDYAFAGGIRYSYTNEPLGYEGPGTAGDEGIDTPAGFDYGLAIPPPIDAGDPDWQLRIQQHVSVCDEVAHTMAGYSTTPDYGQFWLERDYLKDLPSVTIPVLVASNFGDWNVKQVDGWQAYRALTHSVFARMYFGSRWHGHGVPPGSDYGRTLDLWFGHWLKGEDNGLEQTLAPVTSATSDSTGPGSDHYLAGAYPTTTGVPLFLGHASDGTWTLSPDATTAPADAPAATFQWTGLNTETGDTLQPFRDQGFIGFESPPLTQDVRIFGEPVLHLWSTVQRTWVTYTPSLIDFDPANYGGSGASTTSTTQNAVPAMTRGWLDSRYRNGLASETPVTAGQAFSEDISLWPQDYTVRAGHRLVLLISTETADWDLPKAYDGPPGSATVQLDYERGQSYITLPVVGTVTSGDTLFSAPATQAPEAPVAPLLVVAGLACGAAFSGGRRLLRSRP